MIRLKEDINNLESKAKVLLFTQDPLLPFQFLAADKLLTIDAVNILEILQDDLEYEEGLIVLNEENTTVFFPFVLILEILERRWRKMKNL